MNILLTTPVNGNYKEVFKKFDRELFEYLLPKNADVQLVEFGGSNTGDIVHLKFVSPVKGDWISEIVEHGEGDDIAWFVDQGTTLPFGLKFWRHQHIVKGLEDHRCEIIDDIEFRFANQLLNVLLYPALFLAFYPRKRQYRKYFN